MIRYNFQEILSEITIAKLNYIFYFDFLHQPAIYLPLFRGNSHENWTDTVKSPYGIWSVFYYV